MFPVCSTYVLERVDTLGALLNLTTHHLRDELGGELAQRAALCLTRHDVRHLLPDRANLRRPGVGGLLDLVGPSLGEGNAEEAEQVVVGGLDNHVGLNEGRPLADERAQLVGGEVHAVEVGQAVAALNLVDAQLDLTERVVLILLEIGERSLEDTALERIVGVLQTGGAVDEGLADTGKDVSIPCFLPCAEFPSLFFVLGAMRCGVGVVVAYSLIWKVDGALTEYQSFLAKGSTLFFRPFLPFDNLLFLPTAMIAICAVPGD